MKKGTLKRETLFKGKILREVYLDYVTLPNGTDVRLECIKHPGAAAVVPFLKRDKIILIRQYRAVLNRYIWEIPAGTLNRGETPLRCAKRELAEEIGYRARFVKPLGCIFTTPGFTNEIIHIYRADGLMETDLMPDPDEIISKKTFTVGRIRKMLRGGRIVDSKTIAGLTLCGVI